MAKFGETLTAISGRAHIVELPSYSYVSIDGVQDQDGNSVTVLVTDVGTAMDLIHTLTAYANRVQQKAVEIGE